MGKSLQYVLMVTGALLIACPNIHAAAAKEPKSDKKNCPAVDKACPKGESDCHYKLTVKQIIKDDEKLLVTYPGSVFSETKDSMNNDTEKAHVKKIKDKEFTVHVKRGQNPQEGKTYLMKKCPDNEFTVGDEVSPTDPTRDK